MVAGEPEQAAASAPIKAVEAMRAPAMAARRGERVIVVGSRFETGKACFVPGVFECIVCGVYGAEE